MKKSLVLVLSFSALMSAFAYNWTGAAGNFFLDDVGNWETSSTSTDRFVMKKSPGGSLKVSTAAAAFPSGRMLRYSGAFAVTNDFGAGFALVNVGKNAGSGFHVEDGAAVTLKSGLLDVWNSAYASDGSFLLLDGADSKVNLSSGDFYMRGSSVGKVKTFPTLVITNGASLAIGSGICRVGSGLGSCNARAVVSGDGSRLAAKKVILGETESETIFCSTNLLTVAAGARLEADTFIAGESGRACSHAVISDTGTTATLGAVGIGHKAGISNAVLTVKSGARLTLTNGCVVARTESDSGPGIRLTAEGQGTELTTSDTITVSSNGTFEVRDHATARFSRGTLSVLASGTALAASGATLDFAGSGIWVANRGRIALADATLNYTSASNSTIGAGGTLAATNSTLTHTTARLNVNGRLIVRGGSFDYKELYLNGDDAEMIFEDATVNGSRIQMTQRSTIRIINSQVTIPSGLFMMGDSGTGGSNDALKRDIYLSGTNTCLTVTAWNGLYIRGSNTTIHVEIPAAGLSKAHPLVNARFGNEGNKRIKVAITVDPALCEAGGGTYELFRNYTGGAWELVDYEYDPSRIRLVKKDVNLYVRVRSTRGLLMIFR